MGQLLATPVVKPGVGPFLNLPRDALKSLLLSYSLHGEGWGVDIDQIEQIFSNAPFMVESIGYSEEDLKSLFQVFDTDQNGLIDALEMLITLALVSGMDIVDKLHFVYSVYDFDYSGMLSREEISLLLRSAVKGLCKITECEEPTSDVMDQTAEIIFNDLDRSKDGKISVYEFRHHAVLQPVLSSWLHCFGSIEPVNEPPVVNPDNSDVELMSFSDIRPQSGKHHHLTSSKADTLSNFDVVEAQKSKRLEQLSRPVSAKKGGIFSRASSRPTSGKAATRADSPLSPSVRPSAPPPAERTGLANSPKKTDVPSWFADADLQKPDEVPRCRRDPPEDVVEPYWLNGCRASDVRSHLKYGPGGSVLFFTSAIAVQMKKDTGAEGSEEGEGGSGLWQQKFVFDHDAPITCLDYCAATRVVATGDSTDGVLGTSKDGSQRQRQARIVLWNVETTTSVATLEIPDCAGIRYLDFAIDGSRLLALSMDSKNSLMMFDVQSQKLIYSVLLGTNLKVMAMSFAKSPALFCIAGTQGIDFYSEDVSGYMGEGRMVNFNKNQALFHTVGRSSKQSLTNCLSDFEFEDELISGNSEGSVIFWKGRNCVQVLQKVHQGSVLSLHYSDSAKILASGGMDGKVKLLRVTPAISKSKKAVFGSKKNVQADDSRLLEILTFVDINNSDVLSKQIRSVCMYSDGSRVLIGTKSGEITELCCVGPMGDKPLVAAGGEDAEPTEPKVRLGDDVNGGPILRAHWDNQVGKFGTISIWGLCRVPGGGFLSCGSDYTVRRWQTTTGAPQKELKHEVFDTGVRTIACSATAVAAGFDGTGNAARANSIAILNLETLATQQTLTDPTAIVNCIQFSPDGNTLACGCSDSFVYIYTVQEGSGFVLKGKLSGHTGAVKQLDFSSDGQFLRSCENNALIYWDIMVNFGSRIREAEVLKPVSWATSIVPYTWDTKGSFAELVGEEQITCVDRSNHLVVSGLNTGYTGALLLTRLPNVELNLDNGGYRGVKQEAHCGSIAALCYIDEGSKLVTAGAEDGLIQVWRVTYDFDEGEPEPEAGSADLANEASVSVEEDEEESENDGKVKGPVVYDSGEDEDLVDGELMELPERKNAEHLTLRAGAAFDELSYWMQSVGISESSTWLLPQGTAPDAEMSLDWVFGYSSRLTRGSVRYTVEGNIAYPAATIAVVFDKKSRTQLHVMNHQSDISCMDVHPTNGYAVTAQRGKDHIFACVWNTATGACKGRMDCGRVHGASAIAFSPDGSLIAVACQDFSHSILIFDWEHNVLRTRVSGGSQKVLNICFSLAPANYASGLRILQGGIGHFQLLELKGRQLTAKRGLYGPGAPKRNVLCSASLPIFANMEAPNEFVVGMSDGSIGIIAKGERKFANIVPVTTKSVTAIYVMKGTEEAPFKIVTGSIDGHIRIIDHEFNVVTQYNIYLTSHNLFRMGMIRGIKSICVDKANRKILYGTAGGEIGEMNVADGLDINKGALVSSHCRDFVTGVSPHPLRQECATVGGDRTLRIWNLERHSMNTMIELTDVATSVCYSPNAQLIAVGLGGVVRGTGRMPREHEGELVVVSYLQGVLRIVFGSKDAQGVLNAFVFSPDGSELYAASEDGKIYVYDVLDDFKLLHSLAHHTTGVRNLDISEDGRYVASVDADNVLAVWDMNLYTVLPEEKKNAHLTTAQWLTRTIPVGPDTLGVFQPHISMKYITSLHRSSDKKLVATSDVNGGVSLFSYPCKKPGAPYKEFFGHSQGGVALARFTFRDDFLISVGTDDKCLFQWRLNKTPSADILPVENPTEPRDTTAADSAVSAIRPSSQVGRVSDLIRPQLRAQHTFEYHSFAHEEAVAANIDEDCVVPTTIGNVDLTRESDASPPELRPVLKSVLGLGGVSYIGNAKSSMPVAFYCGSGQIVTTMGSMVYTFDSDRFGQSVWRIPDGQEVGAIAVSNDSRYVLVAEKPPVGLDKHDSPTFFSKQRIFNAATGSLLKTLPGTIVGGVCNAAFSPDGLLAACLSCDFQHSITMYNTPQGTWKDAVRTFVSHIDSVPVTLLSFIIQSDDASGRPSPFQLATGGHGALRFWKLRGRNATSSLYSNQTIKSPTITAMLSINPDQLLTGDVEGHISVWEGRDFVKTVEHGHRDAVTAMSKFQSKKLGSGFISGSNDILIFWNNSFEPIMEFAVGELLQKVRRPVTSNSFASQICVDSGCRRMLVTLQSSYVLEVAMDSKAVLLVTEAHSLGKLTAVAAHPTDNRFICSCGADGIFRVWNITTRRPVEVENLENAATCMAFKKNGETIAVGTESADGQSGSVLILSFSTKGQTDRYSSIIDRIQNIGTAKLSCIRYSPDDKLLVCSCLDGKIYFFSVEKGYKVRAVISVHEGPCYSIDFSASGRFLRSFGKLRSENTVQMFIHDISKQVEATLGSSIPSFATVKDEQVLRSLVNETWLTLSPACPEVRGARQVERFSGVGVTDVAIHGGICAAGYSNGYAKIYRNPPASVDADGILIGGHNSGGTRCAFTCDGRHLAVVGAADGSMVIWEVSS